MSWLSFLSPLWAFMGLLAVPLILLYILRQKRPNLEISSTLLWSKTLADMRASTPFQRLRRNLLLLLQLIILAILVLALMRPVIQAHATQGHAGVIVIDASASMQTRDGDQAAGGNTTRLDRAKQEARKLIDSMRTGDRYKVIADGGGFSRIGADFMSNKSDLLRLIDSIQPSATPTDLSESLLLAAESLRAVIGANPSKAEVTASKIYLFSDGAGVRIPDILGQDNDSLQLVRIGSSNHSVGITRLSITHDPKEARTYQVFVGLKNAWPVDKKIGVLLAYGSMDNFLPDQAKLVTLPASGQGGVVFEKVVADPGKLFVRVDDTDDDFPLDNTAYGLLAPPRKVHVALITRGNEILERFINSAVKIGSIDGQIVSPENYAPTIAADLFIFDNFLPSPTAMPRVDSLIIAPPVTSAGDAGGFTIAGSLKKPAILRWKREDPVLQIMQLTDLYIGEALLIRDPAAIALVSSLDGPLIASKDFGPVRRYMVGFNPLVDSNWWQLPSLLVFLQNVVTQTRDRHFIGMSQLVTSGSPAKLWDVGDDNGAGDIQITLPDGVKGKTLAKDGTAEFANTDQLGFYEVASAGKTSTFAVNLLSPPESDIEPRSLHTTAGSNVPESVGVVVQNKEVWTWVAVAALLFLTLEWWVYHRRLA